MPSARPSWSASVALAIGATVLPAQDQDPRQQRPARKNGRIERLVARSIEELRDDDKRLDAIRRLQNLGKLAVPHLAVRIDEQRREGFSRQQQIDMLYVIGKLGRDGLPALGAIRSWVRDGDHEVAQQLVDTLGELAPFFEDDQAAAVRDDWRRSLRNAPLRDVDVLMQQLNIPGSPSWPQIRSYLESTFSGSATCIAMCRWLTAHASELAADEERTVAALQARLEQDLVRKRVTFSRTPDRTEPYVAAAWRAITAAPLNAECARALLTHPKVDQRHRATLWLADHGAPLPLEERADLVGRLWDGNADVARSAAEALGRWGRNGLVGVPALTFMAERHEAEPVRKACREAVAKVRDALQGLQDVDRAWLEAAVDTLLDQNGWPPQVPPSPRGKQALTELLLLGQWSHAPRVARLLDLVDRTRPTADQIGAVYGWLTRDDQVIADAALSFLARHASFADEAAEARGATDLQVEWTRLAAHWVTYPSRGTAFEAGAWITTHGVPSSDLLDLLDEQNSRLIARALAALLVEHPDRLQGVQPTLQRLADHGGPLQWRTSPRHEWRRTSYDLSVAVRVLATLALARHGVVPEDRKQLSERIQEHCGVALSELPNFVAAAPADELCKIVDRMEQLCRQALQVPAHLDWPRTQPN
ncbi:MAG: HEAT repeat domain-containing protein [Planctomycetota bacterium]